jgi:hypothetical protein
MGILFSPRCLEACSQNTTPIDQPTSLPGIKSEWLSAGPDARKELCRPYPKDDLDAYEISTRVNNPGNDDPLVIEPLDHEQSGLGEFSSG